MADREPSRSALEEAKELGIPVNESEAEEEFRAESLGEDETIKVPLL